MMFKVLPDTPVAWRDVWLGALVTSFLFTVGKFAIGFYLGQASVASSYGAAGSVVIVLLWVYYSSLILYLGAEFTHVYSLRCGSQCDDRQLAAARASSHRARRNRRLDLSRAALPDLGRVRRTLLLFAFLLLGGCQRGPQYCLFDGTFIGAAPLPYVAMNPDGTVDETPSRYQWREFVWPTDPQWVRVRPEGHGWVFEGTTGGTPWSFQGTFSADGGTGFVQTVVQGTPPDGQHPRAQWKTDAAGLPGETVPDLRRERERSPHLHPLGRGGECPHPSHLRVTVAARVPMRRPD